MHADDNKPITPVIFTELEQNENNKMIISIQQAFLKQHVEIASPANSDLTKLLREEKHMYANLGIQFAVQVMAANSKRKTQ